MKRDERCQIYIYVYIYFIYTYNLKRGRVMIKRAKREITSNV